MQAQSRNGNRFQMGLGDTSVKSNNRTIIFKKIPEGTPGLPVQQPFRRFFSLGLLHWLIRQEADCSNLSILDKQFSSPIHFVRHGIFGAFLVIPILPRSNFKGLFRFSQ